MRSLFWEVVHSGRLICSAFWYKIEKFRTQNKLLLRFAKIVKQIYKNMKGYTGGSNLVPSTFPKAWGEPIA